MPDIRNLCVVDLETTGKEPLKHEIIEIGCVMVRQEDLAALKEFEVKVRPEKIQDADPEALEINGYNSDEWKQAIPLCDAIQQFLDAARGCTLVGHNVSFDWSFLEVAFAHCKISRKELEDAFGYTRWDTKSLAGTVLLKPAEPLHDKRLSLRRLTQELGVPFEKGHRALVDARATFEVYKKLRERAETKDRA